MRVRWWCATIGGSGGARTSYGHLAERTVARSDNAREKLELPTRRSDLITALTVDFGKQPGIQRKASDAF